MKTSSLLIYSVLVVCSVSCEDFVAIGPPTTGLVKSTVFADDQTAKSAVLDIYYQMRRTGFASGAISSVTCFSALSADELANYNTTAGQGQTLRQFHENTLNPTNSFVTTAWSDLYKCIYKANAILEGVSTSTGMSDTYKEQLKGEALFIRSFCYFYLVTLWGDVPLSLTTDYRFNSRLTRTGASDVYSQIVNDLQQATVLLADDYSFSQDERTQPNQWAAKALLARTYLYIEDWENAEKESTDIIDHTVLFSLSNDLNNIFTKNSTEAIWQFHSNQPANDISTFRLTSAPPVNVALTSELVESFEAGDQRKALWITSFPSSSGTFYYQSKYTSTDRQNIKEYSTVLRLAEQYLIRAEARAQLGQTSEASDDLNAIRTRAQLPEIDPVDQQSALIAILAERRSELFVEWGHRWLDLKRSEQLDETMLHLKPLTWTATSAYYPIPEAQIISSAVEQNPGY